MGILMSPLRPKMGYCSYCMKNIPHVRKVGNSILWLLDSITLRLVRFFRVGPWYCIQCNQREVFLAGRKRSVEDYNPSEIRTESAGNYIRTTESLVIRRNRAARYSQKYRDGVVQRLISGTSTISQIGQELNLSERDIVDWIADALANKQERIDELMSIMKSVQQAHAGQVKISHESTSFADESGSTTIDGEFQSR